MSAKYVCVDIHTVNPGDTLYSIAEKHGTSVDLLMRVNGIRNPYNLKVGSRICIPGVIVPDRCPSDNMPGGNMPGGNMPGGNMPGDNMPGGNMPGGNIPGGNMPDDDMPDNRPPACNCRIMYTVKPGDTLYMIAKMYRVTLDALMNANPDIDPYRLRKGMQICIPE